MNESRGPWYLLTGLVIGAALGLLYAWVVRPVQYTNTAPNSLREEYKDQYRAVIAAAYLANGDLLRARARLDLLQEPDLYRVLAEQAQRTLADGGSPLEARGLGLLAVAVGQPAATTPGEAGPQETAALESTGELPGTPQDALQTGITATLASGTAGTPVSETPVLETLAITPVVTDLGQVTAGPSGTPPATGTARSAGTTSPSATRTPTPTRTLGPTSTPLPTRTATPTQGAPFVLDRQELVCDPDLVQPLELALVQVQVYDSAGKPVPGVESVITWEAGENHFYTGLKPEINPGYADFAMQPGVIYSLRLAEGGQIIPGLTPAECERTGGVRYWGAWRLVFVQP